MKAWLAISLAAPVFTGACQRFGCDAYAAPGIHARVRDGVTGEGVTTEVLAVAYEGAYSDTLLSLGSDSLQSGVYERAGVYRLEVTGAGYVFWMRQGIRVRDEGCHVGTVQIDVWLTPMAPPN